MTPWYEIVSVFLTSAVKFFAGPILAKSFGFSYIQSILLSSIGGISGVLLFFKLGSKLVLFFPNYFKSNTKKKKIFTKKNKFYVLLIRDYGMFGIALLSPILISIPIGSFLAARFFDANSVMVRVILCMSVVFWSVTLSTFLYLF
tara:strand:- start:392 stop:826 length:435 start_codon:yes stop_codon:yes gene_type:complete